MSIQMLIILKFLLLAALLALVIAVRVWPPL